MNDDVPIVLHRPEYEMAYEQATLAGVPTTFLHMQVARWTPAARRRLRSDVSLLRDLRGAPLHALIHIDNLKLKKFAALYAFHPVAQVARDDGEWEIWRLD